MTETKVVEYSVIPIAGSGSRMRPVTYEAPKHNTPLGTTETLLLFSINEAFQAGMKKVILVTNPKEIEENGVKVAINESDPIILDSLANIIIDADAGKFAGDPVIQAAAEALIKYTGVDTGTTKHKGKRIPEAHDEAPLLSAGLDRDTLHKLIRDKIEKSILCVPQLSPEGLGHAVYQAKKVIPKGKPFTVILPDDVMVNGRGDNVMAQMVNDYKGGNLIASLDVKTKEAASAYGVFTLKDGVETKANVKSYAVDTIEEKPKDPQSTLVVMGRYVFDYDVLNKLETAVENNARGAGNEIQLTDAFMESSKDGQSLTAYKYDGHRYDVGRGNEYPQAYVSMFSQVVLEDGINLNEHTKDMILSVAKKIQEERLTPEQIENRNAAISSGIRHMSKDSKKWRKDVLSGKRQDQVSLP